MFSDTTRADIPTLLQRFTALAERAGSGTVQLTLRDYARPLRERWALGERLAALTNRTQQWFAVADRADLARAWGCRGFHLPANGLSAQDARAYLGPEVALSRGCHDTAGRLEPELDACLLSPIFGARKGRGPLGASALARARAAQPTVSWYALGAVDAGNAATCLAMGATGVAVIGAALEPDPAPLLAALGILDR